MNLNKAMKNELIHDLIADASKKQAKKMGAMAQKVQGLWKDLIEETARAAIPELTEDRWIELIQKGSLVPHSSSGSLYLRSYRYPADGTENPRDPFEVTSNSVEVYGGVYPNKEQDRKDALLRAVKRGWGTFFNVFEAKAKYQCIYVSFDPDFAQIPYVQGMNTVFEQAVNRREGDEVTLTPEQVAFSSKAWPILEQAKSLGRLFLKVMEDAEKLRDTLELVILPMKTDKQLIDAMPEAAKFLPTPVPKRQDLAPKELVQNARRMLAEGIPT